MKTPTIFEITADLEAFMEPDGADYTGNLVVRSEKLDDYDIYRLKDSLWDSVFESLTNRAAQLELPEAANENSGGWTGWLWEDVEGFSAWAEEMKALVPGTKGGLPRTREASDKVVAWHKIELSNGKVATFCSLAQLGGLIQCHGAKVASIAPALPGLDERPNVSVPEGHEEYFAGVAKFRAHKFCKSLA
jgi:hypothetical protein